MRIAIPVLFALLTVLALGAYSCGRDGSNLATTDAPLPETVPPDFRLVAGSGGGFTGRWDGFVVRADGTVLEWAGIGAHADSTVAGRLNAASIDSLWKWVQEARFFEDAGGEPGNMSAFLEIRAEGRTHRVVWVPTVEGLEPPANPTEALYRVARRMAAGAAREGL